MKEILNKLVKHVSNGGTVESFMRSNANECEHLFTSLYGSESVCEYCRMTPEEIESIRKLKILAIETTATQIKVMVIRFADGVTTYLGYIDHTILRDGKPSHGYWLSPNIQDAYDYSMSSQEIQNRDLTVITEVFAMEFQSRPTVITRLSEYPYERCEKNSTSHLKKFPVKINFESRTRWL